MTTGEIGTMIAVYSLALAAATWFSRATARRAGGALAGAAAVGLALMSALRMGQSLGLWQAGITWRPLFLSLVYLASVISCAAILLVVWRLVRRFGWPALIFVLAAAAVVGPARTYAAAAVFPKWIAFASGIAPVLAISATFVAMMGLGYAVMRVAAGPACKDRLARSAD